MGWELTASRSVMQIVLLDANGGRVRLSKPVFEVSVRFAEERTSTVVGTPVRDGVYQIELPIVKRGKPCHDSVLLKLSGSAAEPLWQDPDWLLEC